MQGKRVFAYVPIGMLEAETRTLVRIGYTTSTKSLDQLFAGFNRPKVVLCEFGGGLVDDAHQCCEDLKDIVRGHYGWSDNEKFKCWENADMPQLGDKWFACCYTVAQLKPKFEGIMRYLINKQVERRAFMNERERRANEPGQPEEEQQPPVDLQGEPDQVTPPDVHTVIRAAAEAIEQHERDNEVLQAVSNLRRIGIIQDGRPNDVERLEMVSVSSSQAAAILCGVPGSLRDAIDNPQG